MVQDTALGWIRGNIRELGLTRHPDWVHVALVLSDPIRGRITAPVELDGVWRIAPVGFDCEPGMRVPGLTSGRVELFGLRVDPARKALRRAPWTFSLESGEGADIGDGVLVVEPWRRYASLDDCPFYPQIDWRPGLTEEDSCIRGGQFDKGAASDAAFRRARAMQQALLKLKDLKLSNDSGRPRTIRSMEELDAILGPNIQSLVANKQQPTAERIADLIKDHEVLTSRRTRPGYLASRQLREWVKDLTGKTWDEYLISRGFRS